MSTVINRLLALTSSGILLVIGVLTWFCKPRRCDQRQAPYRARSEEATNPQAEEQSQPLLEGPHSNSAGEQRAAQPAANGSPSVGSLRARATHGDRATGTSSPRASDTALLQAAPALGSLSGSPDVAEKRIKLDEAAAEPFGGNNSSHSATFISKPRPEAAVQDRSLDCLLDKEFGPPRFAVPKDSPARPPAKGAARTAAPTGNAALDGLLDKEFGPSKFAVPGLGHALGAVEHQRFLAAAAAQPRLRLEVLSGPAAGAKFEVPDHTLEVVVGRSPDCSLHINDQEVSGRHIVIRFSAADKEWSVVDTGSLNGTILNGTVISAEYRVEGKRHALAEADVLELGSATRMRVAACTPSRGRYAPQDDAAASRGLTVGPGTFAGAGAYSHQSQLGHTWGPGQRPSQASTSAQSVQSGRFRTHALQIHNELPPLAAVEEHAGLGLRMAVHQRLGFDHKRMGTGCEDVVHWELPCEAFESSALLFVLDGHHGPRAAVQAKGLLPQAVISKLQAADPAATRLVAGRADDLQRRALKEAFLETDSAIAMDEGCTATAFLFERTPEGGALLQAANVGDSSALVVLPPKPLSPAGGAASSAAAEPSSSGPGAPAASDAANGASTTEPDVGSFRKLTEDHRISSSTSERARLQQHGHTVRTRLYGLNISRMLGDRFLKDEDLGFLAEPYVSEPFLVEPGQHAYLILASDGLWDMVPEKRAAALVLKALEEAPDATVEELANILLNQAIQMRSKDDISIIVVHVRPLDAQPAAGGSSGCPSSS